MTDEPLFAPEPEPEPPAVEDDLSVPNGTNLARWLEADGNRKVAILAPDPAQSRTWAEARGIPARRVTFVSQARQLHGMYGSEHVIVRVQGPGGTATKADRALGNAIAVARAGDVWIVDDVIPMEAAAPVSQTIGGVEIRTDTTLPLRVMPRARTQGDSFVLHVDGDRYEVSRGHIDELVEIIAAWREARPYVDAAAARAAEIRAAVLAGTDPFAAAKPKP